MSLIDELNKMASALRERENKMFYDTIYGGQNVLRAIPRAEPRHNLNSLWGVQVHSNPMFPYEQTCSKCVGTGDGVESTFCPSCKGAGRYRVEGVAVGARDKLTAIVSYYPRKPVCWPESVAVPLRPSHGIRSVTWP